MSEPLIAGRYELLDKIGEGGMGEVFRAVDVRDRSTVAIKILAANTTHPLRFEREATTLAEIQHPGVVRYIEHGIAADWRFYIVMEWLDGESLADRLDRGALSIDESLRVVTRVAEALSAAHARGVVHRDIKPANILLRGCDTGRATLIDFGVARATDEGVRRATRTGAVLGTVGYMAPEQARGEREIDARVDVFALGCVLFECIAGRPVFVGDHPLALLAKILLEDIPRLGPIVPGVPPALEAYIARMLSKDREERPGDASEILRDLAALDPNLPPPPSLSITPEERRLTCVLLARTAEEAAEPQGTDRTQPAHDESLPALLARVAAEYGGAVHRLREGTLLAFSDESPAADLVARAARCALALWRAAPIHIALATGRAARRDRAHVGEALDRAGALLEMPSAAVRIDEVTAGLLHGAFDVRGDASGLYLLAVREHAETARTVLGRVTPCVGRDRELLWLEGIRAECESESLAQAAVITAPTGGGKSRLLQEWRKGMLSRGCADEVFLARAEPMRSGSPFGLLAPAILRAAGVTDDEPPDVRRRKLRARIGRHLDAEACGRVLEFLGEMVRVPASDEASVPLRTARADPAVMSDQMRRALCEWLDAECAVGPVVWVLEDLQWADPPSIDLMDFALGRLFDRPLLVVATARPEYDARFKSLWSARRLHPITLLPLGRRACERIAREVLADRSTGVSLGPLIDRSAGNPLLLEELIRSAARPQRGSASDTLLALMQARFEAAAPELRRALRAASVFGEVFWQKGVAALLTREPSQHASVEGLLRELVVREFAVERSETRFNDEREMAFRHGLVRDAAYAMLTDEDRALGHRLAGEWLSAVGESDAVVLAEHFERGGDAPRALKHYQRAVEDALKGNDMHAALSRVERAIGCGAAGESLGALRLCEAEAQRWIGDLRAASNAAATALELLPTASAPWYRALVELALSSYRAGQVARTEETARLLLRQPPAPDAALRAQTLAFAQVAMLLFHGGHAELGTPLAERLNPLPESLANDPLVAARVSQFEAYRAFFSGRLEAQLQHMERAQEAFERAGDPRNACMQQANVGIAYLDFGMLDEAEKRLTATLAVAEQMSLQSVIPVARQTLGRLFSTRGRREEAEAALRGAIQTLSAHGFRPMVAVARGHLASELSLAGRHDEALREAHLAVEESQDAAPSSRAWVLVVTAQAHLARAEPREALDAIERARALLTGDPGEGWCAQSARGARAEALYALGRRDEALREITVARSFLDARVAEIERPELREAFTRNVPENRRVLRLYHALCDPP